MVLPRGKSSYSKNLSAPRSNSLGHGPEEAYGLGVEFGWTWCSGGYASQRISEEQAALGSTPCTICHECVLRCAMLRKSPAWETSYHLRLSRAFSGQVECRKAGMLRDACRRHRALLSVNWLRCLGDGLARNLNTAQASGCAPRLLQQCELGLASLIMQS